MSRHTHSAVQPPVRGMTKATGEALVAGLEWTAIAATVAVFGAALLGWLS